MLGYKKLNLLSVSVKCMNEDFGKFTDLSTVYKHLELDYIGASNAVFSSSSNPKRQDCVMCKMFNKNDSRHFKF